MESAAQTVVFRTHDPMWRAKELEAPMRIQDQTLFIQSMLPARKLPMTAFSVVLTLQNLAIAVLVRRSILFPLQVQHRLQDLTSSISAPSIAPLNARLLRSQPTRLLPKIQMTDPRRLKKIRHEVLFEDVNKARSP